MDWAKFRRKFTSKIGSYFFEYKDYTISIEHGEKYSVFLLERQRYVLERTYYKTPNELLKKSRIEGKRLREIWYKII